uniref:Conotoxin Vt15.1 n=1 Tax=Conus planorbis TaxID=97183 RepID=CVF1_CONPO|nr:RecName: Full=Conotoxin Vt15.1; Flags: Precursor [Conus planorbis]ABY26940.1 V1 superfamily conotoxin 15.1 precursor [Conus planorbis]
MMPVILPLLLSLAIRGGDGQAIQGDRDLIAKLFKRYQEHGLSVKRACHTCDDGTECCDSRCSCPWNTCTCIPWGK